MEFFRNTNIDFLGKKWYFLGFSLIFSIAGILSMVFWHGMPLGVDFRGGTLVYVKFTQNPNPDDIRATLDKSGLKNARIQRYGVPANNEVLISLELKETSEQVLDKGKNDIIKALETETPAGKQDLNNTGLSSLTQYLLSKDPLRAGTDAEKRYATVAQAIVTYRDKDRGGAIASLDELRGKTDPAVLTALQQDFYVSSFAVRNVEIVGPQVGKQLQKQAVLATLYSLAGMLVYLWFRFEWIYGAGAVVACFHDTLITVGAFSLLNKEITLTVIAAILTLVGYSMNDTIVIYDRIRENVKLLRRERLPDIVNKSINQTLSRTILTSGLTFLTVLSLYVFGGEVLHGFSFALVVGILIGTYSSIAVAAPMVVAYQEWRSARSGRGPVVVSNEGSRREKVRVKA
ncbi:MAG: protein translocase subunit SecF [Acidobacteriia bacterium]|nr:protein translocase subunit SecF [Terriglobia bacterium]